MTSGEKMNRTSERAENAFRALKPTALDELAEDAHRRGRDAELDRILHTAAEPRAAEPRTAAWRPGRRSVLLAGSLATAMAVAGGVVAASGGDDAARQVVAPNPAPDARTILLASAQTAESAPATSGRYWYTRVRTQTLQDHAFAVHGGTLGRPAPGSRKTKPKKLPYTFRLSGDQESWTARSGKDGTRTITGIGVRAGFVSGRDKAAWLAAGSPELVAPDERKPRVNDYDMAIRFTIGSAQVSMDELRRLPVDAKGLGLELRRRYEADAQSAGGPRNVGPFPYYVWMTAQDLLAGPITPGTKAALYRLLAEQPGVRSGGTVTDQLGRGGVAVTMTTQGLPLRLIINPRTAQLLAYESSPGERGGVPRLSMAYQAMGWVDALGARP